MVLGCMRRAEAEAMAADAGVRDWTVAHLTRKWLWAGHVARRPATALAYRVTTWRDSDWQVVAMELGNRRPLRPSTRRWMKWEDVIKRFSSEIYRRLAESRT